MIQSGRRRVLSLFAGLVPAAFAQQPARVATVGYLSHGSRDTGEWLFAAIRERLALARSFLLGADEVIE